MIYTQYLNKKSTKQNATETYLPDIWCSEKGKRKKKKQTSIYRIFSNKSRLQTNTSRPQIQAAGNMKNSYYKPPSNIGRSFDINKL